MDIIDDLQRDGLVIVRSDSRFAYGHDAVLLTDFVRAKPGERYLDIGTGTGILSILTHAKTGASFVAADIDPECVRMAKKSVQLNSLEDSIKVESADAREISEATFGRFDGAVCNPPYFSSGTKSPNQSRLTSAFDETLNVFEAAACAGRVVKNGGKLFICYPAKYIQQLCCALSQTGFALKRLTFVKSTAEKPPYLVLAEGRKGGGAGTDIQSLVLEEKQ